LSFAGQISTTDGADDGLPCRTGICAISLGSAPRLRSHGVEVLLFSVPVKLHNDRLGCYLVDAPEFG
jgi:hypothetical protein